MSNFYGVFGLLAGLLLLGGALTSGQSLQLSSGFYDDNIPLITYTGSGWVEVCDVSYFGGCSAVNSSDALATIEFSFYGDTLNLYLPYVATNAPYEVCISDICSTIDTSSPAGAVGVVTFGALGLASHDVVISKTTAGDMALDALHIAALTPEQILVEVTEEPNGAQVSTSIDGQSVTFEYSATGGDVAIVSLLSLIAFLMLCGLLLFMVKIPGSKDL